MRQTIFAAAVVVGSSCHSAGLSEGVPQHEGEAQPDDRSDDDGVAPFPEVDLLDQIVDQRKPGIGNNGCQIITNSLLNKSDCFSTQT